ncbi:hypothetical protein [Methylomonas koyamae]|uniref:hypothetical protein n=1 Tax=Methylomonas koyamae TaxID=702114 RepID=UPI0006D1ADF3|nr:hypothetical protein [Methylomonas koyamae]BBL56979.1 hypothetical protein MKFW12EY_05920 [Methylomonas koyamae]
MKLYKLTSLNFEYDMPNGAVHTVQIFLPVAVYAEEEMDAQYLFWRRIDIGIYFNKEIEELLENGDLEFWFSECGEGGVSYFVEEVSDWEPLENFTILTEKDELEQIEEEFIA